MKVAVIGGPEKFHRDKIIGKVLAIDGDTRPVAVDAEARYSRSAVRE